jgi:hypothetical protein
VNGLAFCSSVKKQKSGPFDYFKIDGMPLFGLTLAEWHALQFLLMLAFGPVCSACLLLFCWHMLWSAGNFGAVSC